MVTRQAQGQAKKSVHESQSRPMGPHTRHTAVAELGTGTPTI